MQIHVELFGTLRDAKLPAGIERGKGTLELGSRATVREALDQLGISPALPCAVMVNAKQETDRGRVLQEGDRLTVLPPVAGGGHGEGPYQDAEVDAA